MSTRTMIWVVSLLGMAWAAYVNDLAAIYVAVATGAILYSLHTIEEKLNRLLDYHRIAVTRSDVDSE